MHSEIELNLFLDQLYSKQPNPQTSTNAEVC